MKKWSYLIIFLLVLTPLPISADEAVGGKDRDYYIRIELSQWKIEAYDLNSIEDLILSGVSSAEAKEQSRYTGSLTFQPNARVYLQIFSLDAQHGFSIPDLGIQTVIDRRDYSVYTFPIYLDFETPDESITVESHCQVYCGLGHGDMKFKFVIGDGSPAYGSMVLIAIVVANTFILILFSKKILFDQSIANDLD